MSEKNIESNDKQVIDSLINGGNIYKNLVAVLISSISLIYIIGWVRAKTYFFVFDADWLTKELSTGLLINNSIIPVSTLVLSLIAVVFSILYNSLNLSKLRILVSILFVGTILSIMFGYFTLIDEQYNRSILLFYSSAVGSSILASCLLGLIILFHQNEKPDQKKLMIILLFVSVYGFFISPISIGYSEGLRDRDVNYSNLPHIDFGDSTSYRLLYQKLDLLYYIELNDETYNNTQVNIRKINSESSFRISKREK